MENNPPKDQILPKPLTDLPLPEKQIPAHLASQGQTLQGHALQNKTKWLILLLVLVAVTLIGFAGGKYYLDQQKLKAINDFESCVASGNPIQESYPATCRTSEGRSFTQVLSEEEQKNLLPPDPTANWQTYEGDGFSFKYPSDWNAVIPKSRTTQTIELSPQNLQIKDTATPVYVLIYENPSNLTLQKWQEDQNSKLDGQAVNIYHADAQTTNISGHIAYLTKKGDCHPLTCEQAVIIGQNKIISFHHFGTFSSEFKHDIVTYKDTYDQILSTFKFTDQSISCTPRPSCLDTEPRCMIAETEDMCPPSPTPSI